MSWQRCRSAGICRVHLLKLYAVIFAHRSFKMLAEHIVQVVPVPARSVGVSVPVLNAELEISEDTP